LIELLRTTCPQLDLRRVGLAGIYDRFRIQKGLFSGARLRFAR